MSKMIYYILFLTSLVIIQRNVLLLYCTGTLIELLITSCYCYLDEQFIILSHTNYVGALS